MQWSYDLWKNSFQAGRSSNRLFYLAIPPNIFIDVVRCARQRASAENGWTRVIVEKPFGRDSKTSKELTRDLKQYLTEEQIFRFTFLHPSSISLIIGHTSRAVILSILKQNWSSLRGGACWESPSTSFLKSGFWAFMVPGLYSQCTNHIFWR